METIDKREAWNKGKLVGQKPPLKPKDIWAIRIYLQNAHAVRDLGMFNLAIDSKLRGCDLVSLSVLDVTHGNQVLPRAMVIRRKDYNEVRPHSSCRRMPPAKYAALHRHIADTTPTPSESITLATGLPAE
jgi:hypothetical protein